MDFLKNSILTILLLFSVSLQINAQDILKTNGKAIVNQAGDTIILRGMGLGGWMVQEGYNIPGVIYATNYDLGPVGEAYYDNQVATYHVSTSNYTAWNNGWAYRNDGVDIEPCVDPIKSNGYNVGWTEEGEWLQYEVNVAEEAVYDIDIRYATAGTDGEFKMTIDGADISLNLYVPVSGGWQTVIFYDLNDFL